MTISALAWSIFTSVIGGKANCPLFIASCTSCCGEAEQLFVARGRRDHELDREDARARAAPAGGTPARGRPVMRASLPDSSSWIGKMLRFRSSHGFTSMPPKPPVGKGDLEAVVELRARSGRCGSTSLGVGRQLLERRVRGHVDGAEDDALVLVGRELLRREHVHRHDQQREHDPDDVDRRARSAAWRRARVVARACTRVERRGRSTRREPAAGRRCGCSSFDDIIGESVSATMPEMNTAPASVKANSRKSAPVRPPWKPIGA